MNFRNDSLILRSSKEKKFVFENILNLYSCLVKEEDFYPKNKILNKIAYVGGKNLSEEIKKILNGLSEELKRKNLLKLRKLFLKYCGIKPDSQKVSRIGRLFKKWFKKKLFPIIFLRIITFYDKENFWKLIKKVDFVTSFSCSVIIFLPKSIYELKNQRLCYLIGVIMGDGYLLTTKKDYRIVISDGSEHQSEVKESFDYMQKLAFLFNNLFNIQMNKITIEKRGNWYVVFISSKWLVRFLNFFFDIPIGKKKGKLSTPRILGIMSKEHKKIFWRGMFDTDGMVNPTARNIEIASSDYLIMKECSNFLAGLEIPNKVKEGFDGKKRYKYYWINIKSSYFKKFGAEIGCSHPRKQKVLLKHLKTNLRYYIFQNINKSYLTKKGEFNLKLLRNKNPKIILPKKPFRELIEIAKHTSPMDWEKKRIIFKTKNTEKEKLEDILRKFEIIFKVKPKFLKTRNLYYANSKLLNEFFNKFFIYKSPWKPISENISQNLIIKWNSIFE